MWRMLWSDEFSLPEGTMAAINAYVIVVSFTDMRRYSGFCPTNFPKNAPKQFLFIGAAPNSEALKCIFYKIVGTNYAGENFPHPSLPFYSSISSLLRTPRYFHFFSPDIPNQFFTSSDEQSLLFWLYQILIIFLIIISLLPYFICDSFFFHLLFPSGIMIIPLFSLLFLFLRIPSGSDAASILISPSWLNPVHRFTQRELAAELLRRNHSVTWLEYGLDPHPIPLPPGVTELFLRVDNAPRTASLQNALRRVQLTSDELLWREDFWQPVEKPGGWLAGLELCQRVLEQPAHRKTFEELLKQSFEVVVVDDLYNPCSLLLAGLKRSLFIYWSMTGLRTESAWANQSPSPPSYIPVPGTGLTDDLSFWERSYNLLAHLRELYIHQHIVLRRLDKLFQKHFPGKVPDSFSIERNASINFVPIFDFPRPYMPRVNFVGGLHCKNQTKWTMDKKLLHFINASGDEWGFILIISGFSLQWSNAPAEVIQNLVGAIRELPEIRFVWQYNGPALKDPPRNLYTADWLPQQELLAHPKCRGHMSHGGVNSVVESVWHGVPVIGWPLTANGRDNLLRLTARQCGLMMDRKRPDKQQFISAFHRIYIKHYKEEMLIFQDMVIDVPYTELNHSAFWVEFIVRHQEVPHARSGADDLNIFQYFLVDVVLFLIGLVLLGLYLLLFLLKLLLRLCLHLIRLPFNKIRRQSAGREKKAARKEPGAKKRD